MASIIRQRKVTIPHGTAKTALFSLALNLPNEIIQKVDLQVPSGPVGLMGFYLAVSRQQIIPYESGEFIIWNDHQESYDIEDYPTTGAWELFGYNTDAVYDHSVYLRFHDVPLTAPTPSIPSITIVTSPPLVDEFTF